MPGLTRPLFIAAVAVALLAGCGPSTPPSSDESSSAEPTASSTPTGEPVVEKEPLPENALFRVTVVATGSNGAVADLVQTVYLPLKPTAAESAALFADCSTANLTDNYPDLAVIHGEVSFTLRQGSPAWVDYSPTGVGIFMSNYSMWDADYAPTPFTGCFGAAAMVIPSTGTGMAPISPWSDPAGDVGGMGWYNGSYGFSLTYDGDAQEDTPFEQTVFFTECAIEVSDAAIAAQPLVASWPTQAQPSTYACAFNPEE